MTDPEIKALVHREIRPVLKRGAYFWLIMVLTAGLSGAGSIYVSAQNTKRTERKLCAVVVTTDDAYRRNPPQTRVGREQATNFTRLRNELGCPPYKGD
jgi:hypothetical protein